MSGAGLGADRMRAAFLETQLRQAGFDADHLNYAAAFLAVFSTLDFPYPEDGPGEAATAEATVVLCHTAEAAMFWRDAAGTIHIDVTKFGRFAGTEHIYINFVIGCLLRFHPKLAFIVDLGTLDPYLRHVTDPTEARAIHQAIGLFSHFGKTHTGNDLVARCPFPVVSLDDPPRLFPRPGLVELRAVRAIHQFADEMQEVCREVIENWESEAFMYAPPRSNDANVMDLSYAVRHLVTNAGMYATTAAGLASSLVEWSSRYMSGLVNGEELFVNWGVTIQSHYTRTVALEHETPVIPRASARFGSLAEFYRMIAGRRVLLVSPFAPACEHVVRSGRIKRIWRDIEVPDFDLIGLRAFVSTYPNRPHGSWSLTFHEMCRQVDEIVRRERVDVVLGSCGCYGIPLVEYCQRRHGMSGIYYGNFTNMLFGVKQNDFAGYFAEANLDEWVDPFWGWTEGQPANLERIDGGRYVLDPAAKGEQ